jgi:FtsZ-interacting cell division protein ZipA
VKPGFFEPEKMMKEHFPGLVVFMSTRAEGDVSSIFEKMLTSARHLAASLSGELCDSNRIPLTPHLIQQYRETIKISKEQVSQKGQQMW